MGQEEVKEVAGMEETAPARGGLMDRLDDAVQESKV